MCIAIYKPAGAALPSLEILGRCFKLNPDGAGIAIALGDTVKWHKGLMTIEVVQSALADFSESYGNLADRAMLLHFRIGTHGSKNSPEHTHPFPVCDDYAKMMELSGEASFVAMHNGVLSCTFDAERPTYYPKASRWDTVANQWVYDEPSTGGSPKPSDTMDFIKHFIEPFVRYGGWPLAPEFAELAEHAAGGTQKIFVLAADGSIWHLGHWIQDGGVWYSNEGFKAPVPIKAAPQDLASTSKALWRPNDPIASSHLPPESFPVAYAILEACRLESPTLMTKWEEYTIVDYLAEYYKAVIKREKTIRSRASTCPYGGAAQLVHLPGGRRIFYAPADVQLEAASEKCRHIRDALEDMYYLDNDQTHLYYYDALADSLLNLGSVRHLDFAVSVTQAAAEWALRTAKRPLDRGGPKCK